MRVAVLRLVFSMLLLPWTLFLLLTPAFATPAKRFYNSHNYYVLEHDPSTGASLNDVVRALGVEVVEQAGELVNHWLVRVEKPGSGLDARGRHPTSDRRRSNPVASSVRYFARQTLRQRVKRAPPPIPPPTDFSSQAVADRLSIQDPLFTKQWHLVNDEYPEHSMNASSVWEEMGLTGKGIISSLVDDGLDYTSADLKDNFDAADSYDFNDHEPLPTPKLSDDHHGTRCAGQVAAGKNTACGIGLAYESKVAGVRILSGPISDVDEAASLNYGFQNVSIYSCSWGPPDNGQSMEGPGYLINKAIVNGISNGRNGLGSIYVFASGNGAAHGDQCNFDGYTNSIYSVTVSAVDYKGLHPYYSEPCAANMIVAYSSGSGKSIVQLMCDYARGTSAAAPNAVGVFALALEARPDLTWRDIQYLCVLTARQINKDDPDWEATAMPGRFYSYKYGYGALDAYEYIKAAKTWTVVNPQVWFTSPTIQLEGGTMLEAEKYSGGTFIGEGGVSSSITVTREMVRDNNLDKLEHINVKVWIDHGKRGDVEVELRSPNGIRSMLAGKRTGDKATTGYPGWTFMSAKHWGEDPVGEWTIKVSDQGPGSQFNGSFLVVRSPPDEINVMLPPHESPPPPPSSVSEVSPTTTKQHTKPTANLPGDHGDAPGENTNATFPGGQEDTEVPSASPSSSGTSTPTADEGWFSDMSNLLNRQAWFFVALGAVAVFGIGAGLYFWRRRVQAQKLRDYSSLPEGDVLPMSGVRSTRLGSGGGRTKELYDAFGEVSDGEDDDADEQTRLRSGYDDDHRAGGSRGQYRDEPEAEGSARAGGAASPDKGSDGSWEHAS
ncbi:peptidase S8/S53 domain-containing protein [Mycena galopus ATCC 62051]|nr:peptidase S8/S53 domain-containing protein [Mycena galopus ATCC 62051]